MKTNKKITEVSKITKGRILYAIKKVYREYQNEEHQLKVSSCALCKLYNHNDFYGQTKDCNGCPMTMFKGDNSYPCMNRKCKPVDCQAPIIRNELLAVQEFYKEFIGIIECYTTEELLTIEDIWDFLKKLDRKTAKKYNLL